jgi:hypothetical protein
MQELPALEWPAEWGVQPGFLAELFIDAMNRRPRLELDDSLVLENFEADEVMENDIRPFVNTLDTAGGEADIAEAIVSINALVARDVVRSLEGVLSDIMDVFRLHYPESRSPTSLDAWPGSLGSFTRG